jgi:Periplasmic protein involved in polysaccharide export
VPHRETLPKNNASSDNQSLSVSPEEEVVRENYVIGPGDILNISAWKNEDLTRQVTVLPDGTFSFPLIGAVKASGKTANQLKNELEKKITPYSPEPTISVMVAEVNGNIVYVIGRTNRPGMFPLHTDVTVLQALSMAGGLTPFADKDSIKIIRTTGANTQVFKFDYDKVSNGKKLEQNIVLQRGDVIVVP